MNTLSIIALCLFASSVLQMVGMAIYAEIYKKKVSLTGMGEDEAGQNALLQASQPLNELPSVLAAHKKVKSYKNIFEFKVIGGSGKVVKEISPVIAMKPSRKKTKQAGV